MSVLVLRTPCPDCGIQGIYGGHVRNADNEDGFERCPGPGGVETVLDPTTVVFDAGAGPGDLAVTVADVLHALQGGEQ